MNTPIYDFVQQYAASNTIRFHMPGHKGQPMLGCEPWDITEVKGADSLYEADGIIAQSEANATALFGSQRTLYSTEGSSQCIRAMLYLAVAHYREQMRDTSTNSDPDKSSSRPTIVAARNVHKAFVYAAALLDLDVVWLWPEKTDSLCGCPISSEQLEETLSGLETPPAAVYLTSPDYLGGLADIPALAEICHRHGALLLIDNAHGAYLRFLQPSQHPLDLGADLCCDSAHKTLPVLTGGAYLHIAKHAPSHLADHSKMALALFGSTSPSYLILASLDRCNDLLAGDYPAHLAKMTARLDTFKYTLKDTFWNVVPSDPLRLTLRALPGTTGISLSQHLRDQQIECEYADKNFLVLMLTPSNTEKELEALWEALGKIPFPAISISPEYNASSTKDSILPQAKGRQMLSIRQALFAPHEVISVEESLGRICGTPTVSCPPAIPIAVSGEEISEEAIQLFRHYGVTQVDVVI
ncbi:MAG: PLP-dependent transferase [Lachnospiraceae bacterium]|nr:PLP-dependent transferase [Lachnospiraceae bacterium]